MEIRILADIGDGPVELVAGLWPLVQWERRFDRKASQLGDGIGLEDLGFLAYEASKEAGIVVPSTFDAYLKKVVALQLNGANANPTKAAASDDD